MKKRIHLLALILLVVLFAPITGQAAGFKDVSSSYRFYDEVAYLSGEDIIFGFPDGSFKPDHVVTRAQAAMMIGRALNLNGDPQNTIFKDVPSSVTGSGYIASAVEKGIISGFPDKTYRPGDPVTRGQMALFLDRAFTLTEGKRNTFLDVASSMKAYEAILNVSASGIASGYPDHTYRPDIPVTRGQFSAFMARTLEPSFRKLPSLTIESISGWAIGSSIIEVDIDHEWVINFNDEIDWRSLYENIYVVRARDNTRMDILIPSVGQDDKKSVKLRLGQLYDTDETYYLYVTKDVKSINGTHLAEPLKLKFQTKGLELNVQKTMEQDGIKFDVMLNQTDEKLYAKVKATNVSEETIPYMGFDGCDAGLSTSLFTESDAGQVNVGSKWRSVFGCTLALEQYYLESGESIEVLEVLYPPTQPLNEKNYLKVRFQKGLSNSHSPLVPIDIHIDYMNSSKI